MTSIWLVEDNAKIRAHVTSILADEGFKVKGMATAEAVQVELGRQTPDLMLLDIRLPGISGLDLIHQLGRDRLPPTIVVSGEATISEALEAMRLGVHDFIEKPFSDDRLIFSVRNCLEKMALRDKVNKLERELSGGQPILGEDPATSAMLQQIEKVAPTNGRVLITGESGTGKELVAATIHRLSRRREKPFVKINCAAFPVHLIEDELFGHVKGAFTDAHQNKIGLFEQADGGTLFLDEIGDMDYSLQARLLRVLEDGKVRRIGDKVERQVDVRVLAATNCDLLAMSKENRFREDLYYRLAAIPIQAPPLRERPGDIPILISYYIRRNCVHHQISQKEIMPRAMTLLQAYNWPGNIRELKNLAERLVIFGGSPISSDDLPSHIFQGESQEAHGLLRISELPDMSLKDFKTRCEKEYIETMLHRANWNYKDVAKRLEINRSYLHQKITGLGIQRLKDKG